MGSDRKASCRQVGPKLAESESGSDGLGEMPAATIAGMQFTFDLTTIWAIAFYSAASSMMLVVNKVVLTLIPLHSAVTVAQLAFCAALVFILRGAKIIEVDDFEWEKVKPYSLYIGGFCMGIYSNMRALANSNVETVIVFRACTPLVVAVLDVIFLGRHIPNAKSILALIMIFGGALGYVASDHQF